MFNFLSKIFDFALNTYGNLLVLYSVKSKDKKAFSIELKSPYFSE